MTVSTAMGTPVRRLLSELEYFPGNAREGDVEAIAASIEKFGLFAPITVQASTSYILAGNHTAEAALSLGWSEIDCYVVDVDDAHALEINVAANKLTELGGINYELLAAQLEQIEDLAITGFSEAELEDILLSLETPAASMMPVYDESVDPGGLSSQASTSGRSADEGPSPIPEDAAGPEDNSDRRDKFDPNAERRNSGRRLLVLDLPVSVFLWVSDRLEELCKRDDVQTNAEMILELVARETGSEAPALIEEESA